MDKVVIAHRMAIAGLIGFAVAMWKDGADQGAILMVIAAQAFFLSHQLATDLCSPECRAKVRRNPWF